MDKIIHPTCKEISSTIKVMWIFAALLLAGTSYYVGTFSLAFAEDSTNPQKPPDDGGSLPDSGPPDSGTPDSGPSGGTPSGGTPSGGTPSGGTPSGGTPSGGSGTPNPDTTNPGNTNGGSCQSGCHPYPDGGSRDGGYQLPWLPKYLPWHPHSPTPKVPCC